jgi:transposase
VETEQQEAFAKLAASRTDWTLQTLAQAWQEQGGKALSQATNSRTLRRNGFSYKKSAALPPTRLRVSEKSATKSNETPSASR